MDYPLSQAGSLDLYNGKFTDGVPGLRPASLIPSGTTNDIIDEIKEVQAAAGLTANEADKTQLRQAIRRMQMKRLVLNDFGVANSYTAANVPPLTAADLVTGLTQVISVLTGNNGPATYAPDGLPSKPILGLAGLPLQDGEMPAKAIAHLEYVIASNLNAGNGVWVLRSATSAPQQVGNPTRPLHALNLQTADLRYAPAGGGSRVGEIVNWPYPTAKQNGILCNGSALPSSVYAALFAFAVKYLAGATISITAPAVVTWPGHPLYVNAPVKFTSTGTLPTGLVAGTTYYVMAAGFSANTFQISATIGGAAIIASGVQSGVHTAIHAVHGCANDLSTFNVPNIPAGHTTVQAAGNEGIATVGEILSHTHSGAYMRSDGGSNSGPGAGGPVNPGGVINYAGGPANLAAGLFVRKYILFA